MTFRTEAGGVDVNPTLLIMLRVIYFFFFLNDAAPPDISPLPLHDALPFFLAGATLVSSGPPRTCWSGFRCIFLSPVRHGCPPASACRPHPRPLWLRRRQLLRPRHRQTGDRKSTRLNSSHSQISYAVFCLKK